MEPTIKLSGEQIEFFKKNGYLAIEAITTAEEVERLKIVYDRIFSERAGREEGQQFDLAGTDEEGKPAALPQILNPSNYAPELKDSLLRVNGEAVAKQLLECDALGFGEHAILKPAGGSVTPWHQDEAYWAPDKIHHSLSMWVPLQPATLENGCLHFIPGTHKSEVLPHHSINYDPRVHGLEVDDGQIDTSLAVACPIPAGGATFHYSRTFHFAEKNKTQQARRAYILTSSAPKKDRTDGRRFPWMEEKKTARMKRKETAQAKV